MDYAGLIGKFKVNRFLTQEEKDHQLHQKRRLAANPHYQFCVIKLNSTYLESADKWYGKKGFLNLIAVVLLLLFGCFLAPMAIELLLEGFGIIPQKTSEDNILAYGSVLTAMLFPMFALLFWLLKKESFAFTHYPTRYNRKTGMVHVFRVDGSILSVPWKDIYFTMAQVDHVHKYWNIFGHVLAKDGVTVLDSFALSISEIVSPDGLLMLQSHWEFIRRYMEDGPESISGQVQFCLPISEQRESFTFGMHRLLANNSTNSPGSFALTLASMPLDIVTAPFRYFGIRTSKIPQWPTVIDAECAVEIGDPYAIEGGCHGERIAVFSDAASAAGVGFKAPPNPPYKI